MAQGDEFAGPFRRLDSGDLRHGQDIAFGQGVLFERANRRWGAEEFSRRNGLSALKWFMAGVDHFGGAALIQM